MLLFLFVFRLVSSELVASKTILNSILAEGEIFTCRFELTNTFQEEVHKVTLFDPSFPKQSILFVEGKSKAKLTFGSLKASEHSYVDLLMIPKHPMSLLQHPITVAYMFSNETSLQDSFPFPGRLEVLPKHQYYITQRLLLPSYFPVLLGSLLCSLVPLLYSAQKSRRRLRLLKSKLE